MQRKTIIMLAAVIVVILAGLGAAFVLSNGDDDNGDGTLTASPGLISPQEYVNQFVDSSTDHYLLDVRTTEEFADGHIAGAQNIPLQVLEGYLSEIPTDKPVVVYCRSGNRSGTAVQILQQNGFDNVYDIDGGVIAWDAANFTLQ